MSHMGSLSAEPSWIKTSQSKIHEGELTPQLPRASALVDKVNFDVGVQSTTREFEDAF